VAYPFGRIPMTNPNLFPEYPLFFALFPVLSVVLSVRALVLKYILLFAAICIYLHQSASKTQF
jgi:hypothetical protein